MYIKTTFKNIEEFEINSKHYFKLDKQINFNNTFVVFEEIDSDKRQFFVNSLLRKPINNNFYYYYGASGNGKTVTLIGALKYCHKKYKNTLYINCKTLRILLYNNEINLTKQILIDEIFFLFSNNYENYEHSYNLIHNFNFKNEYDFGL